MNVFKDSPPLSAKVIFTAPVYTTENVEKVEKATSNIINYGRPSGEEIRMEIVDVLHWKKINENGESINNPLVSDAIYKGHVKNIIAAEGDVTTLTSIHYLIRKEEIIDTAKSTFLEGLSEDGCKISVLLNKQAALMKKLSFPADKEPLGSILLEIQTETSEALLKIIDWLTPPTKDGIPLFELKLNEL